MLNARAVAYMNCDSGVVYHQVMKAAASPLMFQLMYDTAKHVRSSKNKKFSYAQ